jgi:hypothetical protein
MKKNGPPGPFSFSRERRLGSVLNQVAWEQRALEGDPKFADSQVLPDIPYAEYARLLAVKRGR